MKRAETLKVCPRFFQGHKTPHQLDDVGAVVQFGDKTLGNGHERWIFGVQPMIIAAGLGRLRPPPY